jgi:hypothetical protein
MVKTAESGVCALRVRERGDEPIPLPRHGCDEPWLAPIVLELRAYLKTGLHAALRGEQEVQYGETQVDQGAAASDLAGAR